MVAFTRHGAKQVRTLHRFIYSLGFLAAPAILGGCALPLDSAANAPSQISATGSWIAPEARSENLLYVVGASDANIYTYPAGKLEGTIKGFSNAGADCVDAAQDVWIPDQGHSRIVEYPHGGTQAIRVISDIQGDACAIDPTSGDLAVATVIGTIFLYRHARGKPIPYDTLEITRLNYCAYDAAGDLFTDGGNGGSGYGFELGELPKGGNKLRVLAVNQFFEQPGGIAWDGKHLAVGDARVPVIYELSIKGSRGTRVGTISLGSPGTYVPQFGIYGQTLVAPNSYLSKSELLSDLLFYKYPEGGKPRRNVSAGKLNPRGVALSLAQPP
jgi:hypothetical protein